MSKGEVKDPSKDGRVKNERQYRQNQKAKNRNNASKNGK